jgi:hypothetical protein
LRFVVIALLGLVQSVLLLGTDQAARAQEDVVGYLQRRFQQLGLPITSVKIIRQQPLELEVTLLSAGDMGKGTPDDPINYHQVIREIELAAEQGYTVDTYSTVVVNARGDRIAAAMAQTKAPAEMWLDTAPAQVSDAAVALSIGSGISLGELTVSTLEVESTGGLQNLALVLSAPSMEVANREMSALMYSVGPLVNRLNKMGAHVVSCRVSLLTTSGVLLVDYVADYRVGVENWWMADGMTAAWFPQPAAVP